jgi:hypothetical protein
VSEPRWRAEPYTTNARATWDELARRSRVPHFLFFRAYMDYHADRFQDASYLLYDGGRLAAIVPASRAGDTVTSHGGLTFGGVIADSLMTTHKMLRAFDALLDALRTDNVGRLIYLPPPHVYHAVPAEEDLYALFVHGARLVRRDIASVVRLERRVPYNKGRRAAARRAHSTLTVARDDDVAGFMALQADVLRTRHNGATPTHSAAELSLLISRFPDSIALHTVRDGASLLGGIVVYETETVAHTQYIAASEEGRERGAVDAIVTRLLDDVYAHKRWFDFGTSTDGRQLSAGILRNKESYGARGVAYDRYEVGL